MSPRPMSLSRKLAFWLLGAALRRCSPDTREWSEAMLGELDFIENDWAALLWALGSTTAIFRHSGRCAWNRFANRWEHKEARMNQTGKNVLGVFAGVGIGLVISAAVIGLWMAYLQYLPGVHGGHMPWKLSLLVFVLPEAIFIASTLALWRKRKPMAIGVLSIAIIAGLHFASHFTHHLWHG